MKREMNERELKINTFNKLLDQVDSYVNDGILTRRELTDIVLRRNILAMKQVFKYMQSQLGK